MADTIGGDLVVQGSLTVFGTRSPSLARSELTQDNLAEYVIPLTELRVWDAVATVLSGTPASDDLGLLGGTYGTNSFYVSAGDLKAAGATTRRARFVVMLPPEYVTGETVVLRANAGMLTTVADTSCTVDFEAYVNGRDSTIDGSDLVATAATTMNSLTFAEKSFVVTATGLSAGMELDVRLSITCTDAATGTAVTPAVGEIALLCDIKG
jgi:hypothetical protein